MPSPRTEKIKKKISTSEKIIDVKGEPAKAIVKETYVIKNKLRFTPHITAEALTRARGKFSFQRAVGANMNTSLFLSSLTYAITNRLEVGTVLLNYLVPEHKLNINFKYNFFRGEEFTWSAGFSSLTIGITEDPDTPSDYNGATVGISSFQILMNYVPKHSPFRLGVNYNHVITDFNEAEDSSSYLLLGSAHEFGVDVSYALKSPYDFTFGFGWLRETGYSALESIEFGFGSSVRWYRPERFFSSPTVGIHYSPESGSTNFLVSSSIY